MTAGQIISLKIVSFDSAQYIDIARDLLSSQKQRRTTAQEFISKLPESGIVPLLTYEHLCEMLTTDHPTQINKITYLIKRFPLVAIISDNNHLENLPGYRDLFALEVRIALDHPTLTLTEIRALTRKNIFKFVPGNELAFDICEQLQVMRSLLTSSTNRRREIIAISNSEPLLDPKLKWGELVDQQIFSETRIKKNLLDFQNDLAKKVEEIGDPGIHNSDAVAQNFTQEISNNFNTKKNNIMSPTDLLSCFGISPHEVCNETTLEEIGLLAEFKEKLKNVQPRIRSFEETPVNGLMSKIPSWLIHTHIRKNMPKTLRRMGSELYDSYLSCLSAYADYTFVDKRTNESIRQSHKKNCILKDIMNPIMKNCHYSKFN